ncbi:MAG: type IV pilus assembly protein [Planctomycetota bacterium]|nr:MAG: type IV pilus assembly protein [Planctomycetota bacterium]
MAKAVWGVDVSKFSVKAVRLVPLREGAAEITNLDVIEYPIGQEGADEGTQIREALTSLMKRNRLGGEKVIVSLPGHTTFNRFIKIPPTEPKKVAQLVKFEAQQHIPFPMDQVVWGYQLVEKEYGPGDELELVLFAVKKDIIYQFLSHLTAVNFPCDVLQFSPVALYNFLVHDQDVGTNCFVLDIGAENSDLVVIDGEKFWIRNIPITGNTITKALQQKFQIPLGEAEKLKVNASSSQQAQKIFGVVQPVLRDLVGEIHRSIGYYKSLSKTVRFEKMMLVGNASKTINLQRFLSQNLQIEALKLAKLNKFSVANSVPEAQFQDYLPTLGVACGLGLQGIGFARNKINLLPEEELKKREFAKKKPIFAAAVGLAIATTGLMYFKADADGGKWAALADSAQAVTQQFTALSGKYKSTEKAMQAAAVEPEKLKVLALRRDATTVVMNALSEVLPDNENGDVVKANGQIWILRVDTEDLLEPVADPAAPKGVVTEMNRVTVEIEGGLPAQPSSMEAQNQVKSRLADKLVELLTSKYKMTVEGEPAIETATKASTRLITLRDEEGGGFLATQFGNRSFHRFKIIIKILPSKAPAAPAAAGDGGTPPGGNNK